MQATLVIRLRHCLKNKALKHQAGEPEGVGIQ